MSPCVWRVSSTSTDTLETDPKFVVVGSTSDSPKSECDEGTLEWVKISRLPEIRTFADVKPLLERSLEGGETFTGTAEFDGFDLVELCLDRARGPAGLAAD